MSHPEEKLQKEAESLIKRVPVENLETLIQFMEFLIEKRNLRSLSEHLANPEYDDEPETEEERSAVKEALDDVKAGRVYDLDTVAKEFGACREE